MNPVCRRRIAVTALALAAVVVSGTVAGIAPEGTGFTARLTGDDEPGSPLVVTGTVRDGEGRPVAGAAIYVYQTDRNGVYDETGDAVRPYRIGGWMVTDEDGRYEFRTIKPGPYPEGGVPAHIHYRVTPPGGREQRFDLHFEGDPYLRRIDATVRPVERAADGTLRCSYDLRLRG